MDENKKGSVNEQPQIVLEGKIPGTEESVYFTEEKVDDKGDCGFIALGVSREAVVEGLINLASIDEVRDQLWQEIYEAFETNRLPRTPEFEALFNAFQEPNLPHDIYDARLRAIEKYCKSEDVFKIYVAAYRDKLWLGYKSALLFAQEKKITVYVWRKENNTDTLKVLDSHVEKGSPHVIHMLLTQGYSHYNLLVEAKKPVKSADVSSYVQKMPALNFRNDAHYSFVEKVFLLTEEEVSDVLVVPAVEELKKVKNLERQFQLGRENNARSNRGKELFEEISVLARSVFPELRHPLLNEELKALILNAKQVVEEDSFSKKKSNGLPKKDIFPLRENKKSKSLVSAASKESKLLAVVPSAGLNFSKGDFYSIIDKIEEPVLESLKPYGYIAYKRTNDSRAFVKGDGSSLEISKNGEIRTDVDLKGDIETQARICADKFIAMIMLYFEAAKREGADKVFPPKGLNMEMNLGKVKHAEEITNLTKMYVKKEFAGPVLYSIKEKFSFNGELLFKPKAKDELNLSSALNSQGEMADNSLSDGSQTLSDTNSPRRLSGKAR